MNSKIFKLTVILNVIAIIAFTGCKKARLQEVDPAFCQYISAFTYGGISTDSYIQIELINELPAVELNSEVKDKIFDFLPSIKGTTQWINSNTIRFTPDPNELKPGTKYKASFYLDKILKVEKKFKNFKFGFFVLEQNFRYDIMPYSPVSNSQLENNKVEISLQIANPASEEEVKQMFKIDNSSDNVAVSTVSRNTFLVTLNNLPRGQKDNIIKLKIDGKAIGANKVVDEEILIPAMSINNYSVVDVRMMHDADPHIRITFSDPIEPDQAIEDLIKPVGIGFFTYNIDKNVIRIYPEVIPSYDIEVEIKASLKNINNLYLDNNYKFDLKVKALDPKIKFENEGNILPNADQLKIQFSAVNLWAVDVSVIKIYKNNILYYMQSNSIDDSYQSELRRFGRLVMKKRIRLDEDKSLDLSKPNTFDLDLSTMFNQDPGALYMVKLSMKHEYSAYPCAGSNPRSIEDDKNQSSFSNITEEENAVWDVQSSYYYEHTDWSEYNWEESDDPCKPSYYIGSGTSVKKILMASNIGMIAKLSDNNTVTVAVTNIVSTNPISGASVKLYNYQLQEIGSGKTNSDGLVDIEFEYSQPFVISATKGDDIGYLDMKNESSLSLSRFQVDGKQLQKGLKGYIYGERGIWRPGDTIHLTFILEDKEKKLPKSHPVVLEVYTPFRQLYHREVQTEGVNGFYNFKFATDPSVTTGTWQSYIKVGGASFYKALNIETIKPNRLKINLICDSIINASNNTFTGRLNAQWLHGSPAVNLKSEVELTLSRTSRPFPAYKDYEFNNPLIKFSDVTYTVFDGLLNSVGSAQISTKLVMSENAPGMLKGNILSKVYEAGGDMSFYSQSVMYSPYSSYVGIKTPRNGNSRYLETDKPIVFDIATLNMYGEKVSRNQLEYKVYKLKWSWWWSTSYENLSSYTNNTAVVPLATGTISTQNGVGKVNFQVDYPEWGRYLILVKDPVSGHTAGNIFYVDWPDWRGKSAKTDPEGLTMLSFSTDKETYKVGEEVSVIIPKSSNGRALVSLEKGSRVYSKQWVKTSDTEDTKYTFKVTDEMTPNIYIFISLLQPHSQTSNDLPIRLYGVVNINVENDNSKLSPKIAMPDELKPETDFDVTISETNGKPMTYTLAVVDEGLLDITGFRTPNAWSEFYSKEALSVRTWDLFDKVIGAHGQAVGPLLNIGGDEALKGSSNKVNRFKPVVRFLGPFTVKANGKNTHKITMPQYVGSVRVMVVAGYEGAYGSAEKTVPVKNALMTISTLPRVLGPKEEVLLPVNVFAMSPHVKNVTVSVETEGLLKATEGSSQQVTFNNTGDKILYFKLKSSAKTGVEQVKIKATGGGESSNEVINIEIRNPNPPTVKSQGIFIDENSTVTLNVKTDEVSPYDWTKLEVSRFPSVNLTKNYNYLLDCEFTSSEHLTSRAFPLLYIDKFDEISDDDKKKYDEIITQSIKNLSLRQLSDGGFKFWSTNTYSNEWVSTYAGHFLVEAKNKGYDVPNKILNNWTKYQQKLARNWTHTTTSTSYYSINMTELQQAYRLYTLALHGKAEQGAMNRMKEIKDLSLQAKWRLAAAYAIINKTKIANDIVFKLDDKVSDYESNNNTYGSSTRDHAMIMETYLLLGKTDKAMELAFSVSDRLSSNYASSQETAFGLIAMAKLADKMGQGNINAEWTVNDKKMKDIHTPKPFYQHSINPDTSITVQITNKGNNKIFARLTSQTIPIEDDFVPENTSLNLTVAYTDKLGKPIDITKLKQGTEFTATVTIENTSHFNFNNVVLAQIFPSGWEVYNEGLMNSTYNNDRNSYYINHRDFRDDRVLTYFDIYSGKKIQVSVNLQAAYRGKYYLPATVCQVLYNPTEQGRSQGKWVEVVN